MRKITFLKNLIVLVALLIGGGSAMGGTHITEGFSTTSLPGGWSGDVYFNSTANIGNLSGANGAGFNANNKYLQLPSVNSAGTLTFWMKGSAAASAISLKVEMSVGGGSFTTIAEFPKPHTTTAVQKTVNINNSSNNIVLKFVAYDRTGNSIYLDDIVLTDYIACTASNLAFGSPTTVEKLADDVNFIKTATSLNETTAIVYSSSDTDVATVNSSTGEVDILAAGTTTITATQAAGTHNSVDYCAGEVTYTLNVAPVDPTITLTEESIPAMSAYVGSTDTETITVNATNLTGNVTLAVTGANESLFTLSTYTLTQSSGSVSNQSVTITYTPDAPGSHAATLTLSSPGAGNVTRELSGTATLAKPITADATGISPSGFTANWDAVPGATSYELEVYKKEQTLNYTTDLIISEYGEGSTGNKKYVEIFNGTGNTVDLTNYSLKRATNGGGWPSPGNAVVTFTDLSLLNNTTYVIANNSTDVIGADLYNSNFASWNGDDAIGLFKNDVLIDVFGTPSFDPGTGWSVAGVSNATVDKILIRKSSVSSPNTDWTSSAGTTVENSEWIVSDFTYSTTNQTTNLGSHTYDGLAVTITPVSGSPFTVTGETSKAITGLTSSTQYFYTVKAINGSFESLVSEEETVTTSFGTSTDNPSSLTNIYAHNAQIHFSATAGERVEVYNAVGQKIISTLATDGLNAVNVNAKGVMIVKVGSRLAKVIL